ncbi:erythromycin esterase family protein [Shewanella polaris]|uniref:Erythromycin esterase family protein n=1 Tax=Shewanella polaris TaxID=2588449 RepID=A0A4Y5YF48_9GAMM|nr:erythromycin esterase family protein [Shewanella polaris]QDE31400.1 erythromycin esterase family protein [Shewanella polaris]
MRLWILISLACLPITSWACEPLPAELEAVIDNSRPLLLGEIHGSVETPQWIENIVCNQLKKGPVTLAVELLNSQTDVSGNSSRFEENITSSYQWNKLHTGKTSEAMFELLKGLLPLKKYGLTLVLFDDHENPRSLRMANRLKSYLGHESRLIVYGGNWHTKVIHDIRWSKDATNMGAYLKEWGANPLSINLLPVGGSTYNNQEQGPKVYLIKERQLPKNKLLISASETSGYHWHLNIGRISPSLPKVR